MKLRVIRKFEGSKDGFLSCNPGEIITLISKKRYKYVHRSDVSNSGLYSTKVIQLQKMPLLRFTSYFYFKFERFGSEMRHISWDLSLAGMKKLLGLVSHKVLK